MNDLSERDKIIMDLKSELFDIQQNVKNIKKLEKTNNDYLNENQILHEENNKLEFLLNKTKDQASTQINDLQLEIQNLNDELSTKKETNIKLFLENEKLEKKIQLLTQENNNLSDKLKILMNQNSENKLIIEDYQEKIKLYENNLKNDYINIEKYQKIIKELKEKYDKNIIFFQKKINELQLAINQLYYDNKKLVKIYKSSFNKKEINEETITSLINSNLLPKSIILNEINDDNIDIKNIKLKRNNSNYNFKKIDNDNYTEDINEIFKTPIKESFDSPKYNKVINHKNNLSGKKQNKSVGINMPNNDDIFTPYGYDINKSYNFNKMKLNKNKSKKEVKEKNKKILNYSCSMINDDKNDNKYFYELIKTQEENVILKKQILNLAQQNEKIIEEIDNIVKISGMATIDVTTEGIKHLEKIILNNRELLEKYLGEIRKSKY